ncbi:MAG: hypothetical protein IJB81_06945 [Clostridia bacterium]|nr:hypothetical protein [Clostridia bacterium]
MKKLAALLLCVLMMQSFALAEIQWPAALTSSQAALRNYVDRVNLTLAQQQAGVIDMLYELYTAFASLGMNGEETPETAEIYFQLGETGLHSLTLRMTQPDQFQQVAAACLASASNTISLESALEVTSKYADVLRKDLANKNANPDDAMTHSFEEDVVTLQGTQPRAYFAYYPNQYGDDQHWLQMTLIFARPGSDSAGLGLADATPAPAGDVEYEGFFSQDNYTHLEIFATPTPEPDSAAMEDWR